VAKNLKTQRNNKLSRLARRGVRNPVFRFEVFDHEALNCVVFAAASLSHEMS